MSKDMKLIVESFRKNMKNEGFFSDLGKKINSIGSKPMNDHDKASNDLMQHIAKIDDMIDELENRYIMFLDQTNQVQEGRIGRFQKFAEVMAVRIKGIINETFDTEISDGNVDRVIFRIGKMLESAQKAKQNLSKGIGPSAEFGTRSDNRMEFSTLAARRSALGKLYRAGDKSVADEMDELERKMRELRPNAIFRPKDK